MLLELRDYRLGARTKLPDRIDAACILSASRAGAGFRSPMGLARERLLGIILQVSTLRFRFGGYPRDNVSVDRNAWKSADWVRLHEN